MESWVDGVNYESKDKYPGQYSEQGMWRIEISPTSKNEKDYFLNSMYVTDYDRNLPELPMYKGENGTLFGVTVMDRAVYFPKNGSVSSKTEIVLRENGYDSIKCLITDIESGLWKVSDSTDGSFKVYRVAEDENTLYFRAAPGTVVLEKLNSGEADSIVYEKMHKPMYGDFLVYDTVKRMFYPLKSPTVIRNGICLVPAEEFFGYNGFAVEASNGKYTVSSDNCVYIFSLDNDTLNSNGVQSKMITAPQFIGGVLYINPTDFSIFEAAYDTQAKILGVALHDS